MTEIARSASHQPADTSRPVLESTLEEALPDTHQEVAVTSGNVHAKAPNIFDQAWEEQRDRGRGLEPY